MGRFLLNNRLVVAENIPEVGEGGLKLDANWNGVCEERPLEHVCSYTLEIVWEHPSFEYFVTLWSIRSRLMGGIFGTF